MHAKPKRKPRIASITLSWNAKNDLRELLNCVKKQSLKPDEVIVVDNASSDGTEEMIKKEFPFVRFIQLNKNYGYAAGYNKAFSSVSENIDYVAALDQDVLVGKDHIKRVAEKFEKEPPSTIIIAGDIEEPLIKSLALKEGYTRDFHGSCFAYRNKHREQMRFCEEFFGYNNEADLSSRLLNRGFRILFYPEWKVFHKKNTTRVTPFTTYYMTRNSIWHYWRNGKPLDAVLGSFIMALVFYSKASRNRTLPSYFKGLFDAIRGLPFCIRTREPSKYVSYKDIHDLQFIMKKIRLK
ncbi:MAG: glycosyltransferase [Candidatus Aenigmarchaeota archaeon]|nr:glycosyltransferase [Candidatus Aenigmarchaeota archaeon]